jgi:asparagine synthase (glutamine-hydrolysing)
MCGIAGYLDPLLSLNDSDATGVIQRMSRTIIHRGPDDGGCFTDTANGIALANRRLAVVDLSPHGRQPMRSACGRYVMVFNGEIYNHQDLRRNLIQAGGRHQFRGHSDTETLLEAAVFWGVKEALRRSVGMFALALWDTEERVLTLARDRIGEKPLYYGWSNGTFLFGSELKALRAHPRWTGTIDRDAEALYFRFGCVPGPRSIYAGIGKLPAGTIAVLGACTTGERTPSVSSVAEVLLRDLNGRVRTSLEAYWSANSIARSSAARVQRTDFEATAELDRLLRRAVARQMLADVPVGTLLSGGIDSSAVTAIAQAGSTLPVRTFTIGFEDRAYDESEHAAAVARHLGTDHTSLIVSPRDALAVIPLLPNIYDEPFADSSQVPTYLVARLARTKVTVALSGDGGDEMFGGYNRHYWIKAFWERIRCVPKPVRRLAAATLVLASPETWGTVIEGLAKLNPSLFNHRDAGGKMHKLASVLVAKSALDMNEIIVTGRWPAKEGSPPAFAAFDCLSELGVNEQIMFLDLMTYLPDDILVKVDRASMAVSLETRAPFLDHEVAEFAWSLPLGQKIRAKTGKWLLREVLYKYVPRELIDRPKMGFGVPVRDWLRGPLREWAESLLTPEKLDRQKAVDPALIRRRWKEHLSGTSNWTEAIWCVLVYQAWLDNAGTRYE